MTTRTIYVAADGEEFETEEECLEYERQMNPEGAVIFFDENCHRVEISGEEGLGFAELFDAAIYLYVRDAAKATDYFDWVRTQVGGAVPENVVDGTLYFYNDHTDTFDDIGSAIGELVRRKANCMRQVRPEELVV